MVNKEKKPNKLSKKERRLEKKFDKKFSFADIYRKAEQQYLGSIHDKMDIEEDQEIAKDPFVREAAIFMENLKASVTLNVMKAIEEQNNFLIGGPSGEYVVGMEQEYNPEEQLYLQDDFENPPPKGSEVVVEMAQISIMKKGTEYILMPAVVARPLPKNQKNYSNNEDNEVAQLPHQDRK